MMTKLKAQYAAVTLTAMLSRRPDLGDESLSACRLSFSTASWGAAIEDEGENKRGRGREKRDRGKKRDKLTSSEHTKPTGKP